MIPLLNIEHNVKFTLERLGKRNFFRRELEFDKVRWVANLH